MAHRKRSRSPPRHSSAPSCGFINASEHAAEEEADFAEMPHVGDPRHILKKFTEGRLKDVFCSWLDSKATHLDDILWFASTREEWSWNDSVEAIQTLLRAGITSKLSLDKILYQHDRLRRDRAHDFVTRVQAAFEAGRGTEIMSLKDGGRAFWSFGILRCSVLPWRTYRGERFPPIPPMLDDDIQWLRRNGVFIRSGYKKVEARLQKIINHFDAQVSRRTDLQEDYHRWRDAAVTNSAKLQRWVNAERSWSIFIIRTLCAKLQEDPALLVDKFLFGSWPSEESSFTGNDTAGCDASGAEQRGEMEEEEEEAEEEQQEDEEVEEDWYGSREMLY